MIHIDGSHGEGDELILLTRQGVPLVAAVRNLVWKLWKGETNESEK